MKRNTQIIVLAVLLLVFCACIFASCNTSKVDYFTYSEEDLGVVGKLVKWMHGWVGNYGWTVVVFTVFLKIIMLPLDLWQRISSKKSGLKMQRMQPLLAEIDKRYGTNSPRANEEKQKLYKKQGFSGLSMCLPMIVSMIIFFVMFGGLRDYSTYSGVTNFQGLSQTYFDSYYQTAQNEGGEKWEFLENAYNAALNVDGKENTVSEEINARIVGINAFTKQYPASNTQYMNSALLSVREYYEQNHEEWLWIQNVWQPDTWATIMPGYTDKTNGFSSSVDMSGFGRDNGESHYELIRNEVLQTGGYGENGTWNGLMILPILSIGLSFLSLFITQWLERHSRKGEPVAQSKQQATQNKVMMIMMPLLMAFFGFMYTGAFAIYMVSNYLLSIVSTVALHLPVEKIVKKSIAKLDEKQNSNKASYMR